MIYQVQYMPRVTAAIDEQVRYLLEQHVSAERVSAWLSKLYEHADGLEEHPRRFAVDEEVSAEVGVEIRSFSVGDYLFFYHVNETQQRVDVVHFRHSAQETNQLTESDL